MINLHCFLKRFSLISFPWNCITVSRFPHVTLLKTINGDNGCVVTATVFGLWFQYIFSALYQLVKPEKFVFIVESSDWTICKGGIVNLTCSAVGKPVVHTYQLFRDDILVHTSNNSVLFWSRGTTAGGETVYTCVANNTVATANATKAITVNGNYCWITPTLFL